MCPNDAPKENTEIYSSPCMSMSDISTSKYIYKIAWQNSWQSSKWASIEKFISDRATD